MGIPSVVHYLVLSHNQGGWYNSFKALYYDDFHNNFSKKLL